MAKKMMHRVLSFVLCLVLLVSCCVISIPGAVAEDTQPVESYYMEIDVNIINCDNGYANDFKGAGVNNPGAWFGGADQQYKDQGGIVVWHTDKNGRGTNVTADTIDFGPNGLNYIYDGGPTGNRTISGEISGFPTSFAVYNNNDHNHSILGSGDVEWAVTEIRIGTDEDHMQAIWKGDCHVKNRDGAKPTRYKIDVNGSVRVWSVEGISDSDIETNDYTYVKNSKGEYVLNKADYASYTDNIEPWELPYAKTLVYTSDDTNIWNERLEIVNDESYFEPKSVVYCADQYGVRISDPYVAYDIMAYNGKDYTSGVGVDDNYIQTAGDIVMDQKTGKIKAATSGYIAGESAQHIYQGRVTFVFGGSTVACTSTGVLVYPQKQVNWKYFESTYEESAAQTGSITSGVLYGNTVSDADFPGEAGLRTYFDKNNHYTGGKFTETRITEDTILEMTEYEKQAHTLTSYAPVEGDNMYHHHLCVCGYAVSDSHIWDAGKITTPASCKQAGVFTYTCTLCGGTKSETIPALSHTWNEGVITKEPSCGVSGEKTYTCTICGETKTEPVSALTHEPVFYSVAPTDKHEGGVYYQCENCDKYWGAVYNSDTQDYGIPDETPLDTCEQAIAVSDVLPAPYFNIYIDKSTGYDYSTRGAALKYVILKLPDYQPLRFTESVRVPENVSRQIGESGNVITDIGIIYSQTNRIGSIENFEIGKTDVFKMSVKDKNEGVYNGSNWGGVSKHESADGTHLTMNLVVNIDYANWKEEYCARAYITYNYNGFTYTVYDEGFSSRSVAFVAQKVVENPNEPQVAREYCQSQILDNL